MSWPRCLGALAALCLLAPTTARAQSGEKQLTPADYFPTRVGRQWTYELRITAGKKTRSIVYTTRVIGTQEVKGAGVCAVFESRSDVRLLCVNWYRADERALVNPRRRQGKAQAGFEGRILLNTTALEGLPILERGTAEAAKKTVVKTAKTEAKTAKTDAKKTAEKTAEKTVKKTTEKTPEKTAKKTAKKTTRKTSKTAKKTTQPAKKTRPLPSGKRTWSWRSAPGGAANANGTVTVLGREALHLRYYGKLDCVVVRDRGTFRAKGEERTQERTVWLAPNLGIVKEVMEVRSDGKVTFKTEAHLMRDE